MKHRIKYTWLKSINFVNNSSTTTKTGILAASLAIVALFFYFKIYTSQQNTIANLNREITDQTSLLNKLKSKEQELKKEKLEFEQQKINLENLFNLTKMLDDQSIDPLNNLLQYAEGSELKIIGFDPQKSKSKNLYDKNISTLKLEGAFFNLLNFLQAYAHEGSINKIKKLTITRKKEDLLDISVTCNFYKKGSLNEKN